MDARLSWLILFSIIIVGMYLIIGLFGAKMEKVKSLETFLVGDRKEGLLIMVAILLAGTFSGFMVVGVPALSYVHGIATYAVVPSYFLLVIFAGYLVWVPSNIIGRKYGYISCADLFIDRYESKFVGLVLSIIWLVYSIPYMVGQIQSAGALLQGYTQGFLPYWAGVAFLAATVVLYIIYGGMKSFAWVTLIQFFLLLATLFIIQIVMGHVTPGGFSGAMQFVQQNHPELLTLPGPKGYFSVPMLIGWGLFMGVGTTCYAHLYPRMYSIKDSKTVVKMLYVYIITGAVVFFHWYCTGPMGRVLYPDLKNIDTFIPLFVGQNMKPLLAGIIASGILAAILSTTAAILLSLSGLVSREFYQILFKPKASNKELLIVTRVSIALLGGISVIFALLKLDLIAYIVALSMSGMLLLAVPIIGAFWWPRSNKYGTAISLIVGESFLAYALIVGKFNPSWGGTHAATWAFLLTLVLFVVICLATPSSSEETIEKFHGYLATKLSRKPLIQTKERAIDKDKLTASR